MSVLIEACIDDIQSARYAVEGGADRLELCDNLADGGTTPSHALIEWMVANAAVPVFPIIRVRGGGFVYSADELDVMCRDAAHARALGAPGIVIGALNAAGEVDRDATSRMMDAADGASITFHRAFDRCRDPFAALETLVELGVDRILTSGQRARAWEGRELIAELVRRAGGRISIMAGGAVNENDAAKLVHQTGVSEIHVRATMIIRDADRHENWSAVPFRKALPGDEAARLVTDPQRIRTIRTAIDGESR